MVNLTDFTYFICHWNSERNSFNNWRKEIWHIFSFPWLEIWKLMFIFFWKISISKIFKTSRLTWFLGQHTKGKYDIFQTHKTTKLFIYCDVTALLDVCLRILPMLQNRTRKKNNSDISNPFVDLIHFKGPFSDKRFPSYLFANVRIIGQSKFFIFALILSTS
jgi:hypothetical protein